jgi:prepilin-type N-terminal cleavage/methylation domain-containing protein
MMNTAQNKQKGFSLLEALIAILIGAIILGAASTLVSKALQMTDLLLARAEMQQDARAALNSIVKDLTLAGTSMPVGGVQLPTGPGSSLSLHGCRAAGVCYLRNTTFPNNHLYYAFPDPGDNRDVQQGTPDAITLAYADKSIDLGNVATLVTNPPTAFADITPSGSQVRLNNSVAGVRIGDLIMLTNVHGSAIGMVTNVITATNALVFANSDPLNINQSGAAGGNIASLQDPGTNNYPATTASRILLISYYLQQGAGADGVIGTADDNWQLMRQVGDQLPSPVMDGVENIQFSYDLYDDTANNPGSTLNTDTKDANSTPNLIRKVNIVLNVRSARKTGPTRNFLHLTLAVSVSPRNLSFQDRYK